MQPYETDYNDLFAALKAADLALVGILGDSITEGEQDRIGDAMNHVDQARRAVAEVLAARAKRRQALGKYPKAERDWKSA